MASDQVWRECWARLRYTFAEYQPDKLLSDDERDAERYEANYRNLLYECSDRVLRAAVTRVCQTHQRWWPLPGVVNAAIAAIRDDERSHCQPVEQVPALADQGQMTPEGYQRGLKMLGDKIAELRARDTRGGSWAGLRPALAEAVRVYQQQGDAYWQPEADHAG